MVQLQSDARIEISKVMNIDVMVFWIMTPHHYEVS